MLEQHATLFQFKKERLEMELAAKKAEAERTTA
jgi:hypothetical protein